jgi:hypothetical protein
MTKKEDFLEIIEETKAALSRLLSGDPEPFKALWSQEPDVSVLGGFGGYALGWEEVRQNTEMAASRFRGSRSFGVKMLTYDAGSNFGYTVWIEHAEVLLEGIELHASIVIRVTHIFRCENNEWKIIHRHGDPVTERTEAAAILQH